MCHPSDQYVFDTPDIQLCRLSPSSHLNYIPDLDSPTRFIYTRRIKRRAMEGVERSSGLFAESGGASVRKRDPENKIMANAKRRVGIDRCSMYRWYVRDLQRPKCQNGASPLYFLVDICATYLRFVVPPITYHYNPPSYHELTSNLKVW